MGDRPAAGKRSMAEWLWDGLAIRPTLNLLSDGRLTRVEMTKICAAPTFDQETDPASRRRLMPRAGALFVGVEHESVPGRSPICPNSFAECDFQGETSLKATKSARKRHELFPGFPAVGMRAGPAGRG